MNTINVFVVNSNSGFNGQKSVAYGITLGELFDLEVRGGRFENFTVRLNRNETRDRNAALRDGDRISITPSKVEAGC